MERSGSQKALLVISIINIVFASLGIIMSLLVMVGGSLIGAVPPEEAAEALSGSGMTQGDIGAVMGVGGLVILLSCCLSLLVGILGVRAANDSRKIMPVWILAILDLALSAVGLVLVFTGGTFAQDGVSQIVSLAIAVLMFWIANNIKKQNAL